MRPPKHGNQLEMANKNHGPAARPKVGDWRRRATDPLQLKNGKSIHGDPEKMNLTHTPPPNRDLPWILGMSSAFGFSVCAYLFGQATHPVEAAVFAATALACVGGMAAAIAMMARQGGGE